MKTNIFHATPVFRPLVPLAAFAASVLCAPSLLALEATKLRVEHTTAPLGIDTALPRFSWVLHESDSSPAARNQHQTAYRILVASSAEKLAADTGDIWDSGLVNSGQSHLIPLPPAARLAPNRTYHWKVRTLDRDRKPGPWSKPAHFATGPLSRENWHGQWIKHPTASQAAHLWFRKKLTLDTHATTALAHIASLGYHEFHINGKKVGTRHLAPALSHYKKRALYVTYDISPLLQPGENTIALWTGPGWTLHRENPNINHAILVQVDGQTSSGARFTLHSDASWKTAESSSREIGKIPRRMGGMGGEEVDGRADAQPWDTPAFDDSQWPAAAITTPIKEIDRWPALSSANLTDPTRVAAEFPAKTVTPAGNGACRVDMGRAFTGFIKIKFNGLKAGDVVTIRTSDRKNRDITFDQEQRYIARGADGETFTNRFNFASGRYLHISGLRTPPSPADITAQALTSAAPRTGTFTSSSKLFNSIHETDLWTYEMCTIEGLTTDCPNRERLGYGAETAYMTAWGLGLPAFDSGAFYKKNIRDWADTQTLNGTISATAPQTYGGAWGGPLSSSAIFNLAWEHYLAHADKTVLEEALPVEKKWLDLAWKKTNADGLPSYYFTSTRTTDGYFLGDWLAVGHRQDMNGDPAYLFNLLTLTLAHQLHAKTAQALGKTDGRATEQKRLQTLRRGIQKFYKGGGIYLRDIGAPVSAAFALHTGATPGSEREIVLNFLAQDLTGKRPYFDTGSFGRYPYFKTLFGDPRFTGILNTLLAKTTYPGYGYFLEKGETTWPECWEIKDDGCARTHTSYTGISGWFTKVLAGIEPSETGPGYRHFTLRPQVVANLTHAAASIETPQGTIQSAWRKDNPGGDGAPLTYTFAIPVGSTAELTLPAPAGKLTESGTPIRSARQSPGITILEATPQSTRLKLASGKYTFTQQ